MAELLPLDEAVRAGAGSDPDDLGALTATDAEIHRTIAAAADNRMVEALTGWVFEIIPDGDEDFGRARVMVVETICGGLEKGAANGR